MTDIEICTDEAIEEAKSFFGPMTPIPAFCDKTLLQFDVFLNEQGFQLINRKISCDKSGSRRLISSKYRGRGYTQLSIGVTCCPPAGWRLFFKRDYCVHMSSGNKHIKKVGWNLGTLIATTFFAIADAKNKR